MALVSAYRYEGPKVNEDVAKSEAEILSNAIKNADKRKPIEDEDVIMILATRSKPHLKEVYEHYKKICDKSLTEVHPACKKNDNSTCLYSIIYRCGNETN